MSHLREKAASFPRGPGVYLMKDALGRVLYVGKAANLRERVTSYFRGTSGDDRMQLPLLMKEVADVEHLEATSEVDALLMESRLVKDIQPKYNVRLRDDKSYPYVEVTREDFPRVRLTRDPARGSRLFGPFTDVRGLRQSLRLIQRVFRFRTCKLEIDARDESRRFFRPCLLFHVRSCTAPCADRVSKGDYAAQTNELVRFLQGRQSELKRGIRLRMKRAAESLDFEKAARLRDELRSLDALSRRSLCGDYPPGEVLTIEAKDGLGEMEELFDLDYTPRTIEGVDAANLAGEESVGAVVSFVDGRPNKRGYRRFRIKTARGVDDYAMIAEIVERRFSRVREEGEAFPDVLVIDGGAGHLSAASAVLGKLGVKLLLTVGLAKEEELIYASGRKEPVRLERRSAALRLLQHVRDEAHRFARHYHHLLRRKRTFAALRSGEAPSLRSTSGREPAAERKKRPPRKPPSRPPASPLH
jgi:excinuclease ABC subunit C